MTSGAKPDHKAAFGALLVGLSPTLLTAGLTPHPAWPPGWNSHNAQYSADFLAPPALDGLRRITLIYGPANRGWEIIGLFHPCRDAANRLALGQTLGTRWSDCLQGLPFRQNTLVAWRKRMFWRRPIKRQLRFATNGTPVHLDHTLAAILNGWPGFWETVMRPATP